MATVYRMENSDHIGPFTASQHAGIDAERDMWKHVPWITVYPDGDLSSDGSHIHHITDVMGVDDNEYNGPLGNLLYYMTQEAGNWTVGCKDIQQLLFWFPKQSLADFAKYGQRLDVYSVPDDAVKYGSQQLMFDPTKAKLVKCEPLTDLGKES